MHLLTLASVALLAPLSLAAPAIPAAVRHAVPTSSISSADKSVQARNIDPAKHTVPKVAKSGGAPLPSYRGRLMDEDFLRILKGLDTVDIDTTRRNTTGTDSPHLNSHHRYLVNTTRTSANNRSHDNSTGSMSSSHREIRPVVESFEVDVISHSSDHPISLEVALSRSLQQSKEDDIKKRGLEKRHETNLDGAQSEVGSHGKHGHQGETEITPDGAYPGMAAFRPTLPHHNGPSSPITEGKDSKHGHKGETEIRPDGAYPGMASFRATLPRPIGSGAKYHGPSPPVTEGKDKKHGHKEETETRPDGAYPGMASFRPILPRAIGSGEDKYLKRPSGPLVRHHSSKLEADKDAKPEKEEKPKTPWEKALMKVSRDQDRKQPTINKGLIFGKRSMPESLEQAADHRPHPEEKAPTAKLEQPSMTQQQRRRRRTAAPDSGEETVAAPALEKRNRDPKKGPWYDYDFTNVIGPDGVDLYDVLVHRWANQHGDFGKTSVKDEPKHGERGQEGNQVGFNKPDQTKEDQFGEEWAKNGPYVGPPPVPQTP